MSVKFDDFLKEQLQDPEFKREYEALQPERAIIQAIIDAYTLFLEHDEVRRAWDSDSKEPVLSFTRAWMLVRFFNSGQMQMSACNVCSASFVTHKHELESDFVCVMCKPPARIVGMLRKQEDYFGKF